MPVSRSAVLAAAILVSAGLAPAVFAQHTGPSSSGCEATPAQAPTPSQAGAASGTDPSSSGSTGWSGGTGGSYIGTTPGAPTPGSPNGQPATVQGQNPSVVGPVRKDC